MDALLRAALGQLQSGRIAAAIDLFQHAIERSPNSAPARNGYGVALCVADRPRESIEHFQRAISLQPNFALAHANLGNAWRALGQHEQAIDSYRRAVGLQPNFPAAHNFAGLSYMQMGLRREALASFDRAIACDPRYADAHFNRGACCIDLGSFQHALESLDTAVSLDPTDATAFNDRGAALMGCGRSLDALASFERALQLRAEYPAAHAGRATALSSLGRIDEAILAYQTAASLDPGRAETHSDLAAALMKLNRLDAAVASCDRAIALNRDLHDAWTNRAQALLLQGRMAEGWSDYEHRFFKTGAPPPRHVDIPRWDGASSLQDRRILLWSEQGLGDTLQFLRYVPVVRSCGAQVYLEVQAAARPALAGMEGVSGVYAEGAATGSFDLQCPLMSLPFALGNAHSEIPARVPYLRADSDKVAAWRARLGTGRKIGLVCSGSAAHGNDANRSIPLRLFEPIMGLAPIVLLQKEVRPADESALAIFPVQDLRSELRDLSETAALIENLDLVISVDTSVAHLAGALNKPLWILVPWAPDWRWRLDRSDTPWYPSARLFRQARAGDWVGTIADVRRHLDAFLKTATPRA